MVTIASALDLMDRAREEDERHRSGHLEEGDAVERAVMRGRYIRLGLKSLSLPVYRPARAVVVGPGQTLHFQVNYVSKRAPHARAALSGREQAARHDRAYLDPGRGEVSMVKAAGGRYDRRVGRWYVSQAQMKAGGESLSALMARPMKGRRPGRGKAKAGAAAGFQRYVERAASDEKGRLADLQTDGEGNAISFGTLGEDADERAAFWDAVELRERIDGRVQCRAIVELPHEMTGQEHCLLARDLVAPLAERGLPYHAAVHRPDVVAGSDPRNVHLHVLWSERPAERTGAHSWSFAGRKDRDARGVAWVKEFRRRSVETINRHLGEADAVRRKEGQPGIRKRHDARSYRELGIMKLPGIHLGPGRTSLERAGVPTAAGVANAMRESLWLQALQAEAAGNRLRKTLSLAARPGVDDRLVERLLDRVTGEAPAPHSGGESRAGMRLRWATSAMEGVDGSAGPRMTDRRRERRALAIERAADAQHVLEALDRAAPGSRGLQSPPEGNPSEVEGRMGSVDRGSAAFLDAVAVARSARAVERAQRQTDDEARRSDVSSFLAGGLQPGEALERELSRRRGHLSHRIAEQAAAEVELGGNAAPAGAERRFERKRKKLELAGSEVVALQELEVKLPGLSLSEARSAVLRMLGAVDPPPAMTARRKRQSMER